MSSADPIGLAAPSDPAAWTDVHGARHPGRAATVYHHEPRTSGWAAAAVMASVLAFIAVPVVPAAFALIGARRARQDIAASGGELTGAGLATLAIVIAIVHLGLVVAVGGGAAVTFLLRQ